MQISQSISMASQTTVLLTYRAIWFQQPVSWPLLGQNTYYWVVISPTTKLSISAASQPLESKPPRFQGAVWAGLNSSINPIPASANGDPTIFRARMLRSQTGSGDAGNAANTNAAINFVNGAVATTVGWTSYAGSRLFNWQAAGSTVLYGIQVIGYMQLPTSTTTATGSLNLNGLRWLHDSGCFFFWGGVKVRCVFFVYYSIIYVINHVNQNINNLGYVTFILRG
jgi:hypothetical protein